MNTSDEREITYWKRGHPTVDKMDMIYRQARNVNLMWRFQILKKNFINPIESIDAMEEDIFWDLSEIDIGERKTKGFRLTRMHLQKLPRFLSPVMNIRVLDLSHNKLNEIPSTWFDWLNNLQTLNLTSNQFEEIPWNNLAKLTSLKRLDLSSNPIRLKWKKKFKSFNRLFLPELKIANFDG